MLKFNFLRPHLLFDIQLFIIIQSFLFCHDSSGRDLGDVLTFDLQRGLWSTVAPTGPRAIANFGRLHSVVSIDSARILLAFGSWHNRTSNEVTIFNILTGACSLPQVRGVHGQPRERSTQALIRLPGTDTIILYGGMNQGPMADTWSLTMDYPSAHTGLTPNPNTSATGLLLFRVARCLFACCRANGI